MPEKVTWINTERPPTRHAGFVETESARKMMLSLRSARATGGITMIIASSGVGKTKSKFQFRDKEAPKSIIVDIGPDQARPWGLACALCERLGLEEPNARNLASSRRQIANEIGPDGFVMIDEAQNLIHDGKEKRTDDYRAFEWARMMQEEGGFGLAFIGDTNLDRVLAKYPQLKRRTHPRVRITGAEPGDVEAFCHAHGLTDERAVRKMAASVQGQGGGLGALSKIKEAAWDMKSGDAPTADDWLGGLWHFEKGYE